MVELGKRRIQRRFKIRPFYGGDSLLNEINPKSVTASPSSSGLIRKLADSNAVQGMVVGLKLPQLINRWLETFPIQRRTDKTGLTYRIRRTESLLVAEEVFTSRTYGKAIDADVRTIVDIGCNTGYFPLFCAEVSGRKDIVGIAIDANPEMATETQWHMEQNQLAGIEVIFGLAGAPQGQEKATFYVSQANVASSVYDKPNPNLPKKGDLQPIQVPVIDLADRWKSRHTGKRINVLKIDVEGFEKDLIENSTELLALVDRIAVEIHKWIVSPEEIEALLGKLGFERFGQEGDSSHSITVFFRRKA